MGQVPLSEYLVAAYRTSVTNLVAVCAVCVLMLLMKLSIQSIKVDILVLKVNILGSLGAEICTISSPQYCPHSIQVAFLLSIFHPLYV